LPRNYSLTFGTSGITGGTPVGNPRDDLQIGDFPTAENTGVITGISRTTYNGDITVTTPGTVLENMDIRGKVIVNAANVLIRNCWIMGPNSYVGSSGGSQPFLVTFDRAGCVNAQMIDCTLAPIHAGSQWAATNGHDYLAKRCNMYHVVDGPGIYNTNLPASSRPYQVNVTIQQSWVHDLAFWTASSTGIVHPSDTNVHADCIEIQGGLGWQILGNRLDAYYSHQYAHWWDVNGGTAEPYSSIALGSLADGGPYQALPDRGSGTEATGRYNWGDLCPLTIVGNVGVSAEGIVTDNWFNGGQFSINSGTSNTYDGVHDLGVFYRNVCSRDQGYQSSGGNATQTFMFRAGTGMWTGHYDAPTTGPNANTYADGQPITVRS
jgi:hypothetical protein